MLKNHLKLAWRNLLKYPTYSLLNMGGLALGIAAAFVLALYVRQELTYDRHFEDSERIYRIATDFFEMGGFAKSQQQLVDHLAEIPDVELATRFDRGFQPTPVVVEDQIYEEPHYFFVDSLFFHMFSYDFVAGRRETVMRTPDEVVLSEELAQKYFGNEPALGRVLLIGKERKPYRVSGVVELPATKTHLVADLWLPLEPEEPETHWTNVHYYNYVKLRPGATQADLERGLDALLRNHAYPASGSTESFEAWASGPQAVHFWVQPLADIYLYSDFNLEIAPGGNPGQVYILGLIGLFILLIAAVNYINLTTARSSVRAKEVGVKKTLGAGQPALVHQFLAETVLFSLLATVLAAGLAEVMLDAFAFITGSVLVESVFADSWQVPALVGFSVLVGLAAGLYPAFYLSSFRPVKILKGAWTVKGNRHLRSALVVLQFSIAIALVISSLVVHEQLSFMQGTDKGFEHEGVLVIENAGVLGDRAEVFRREFEQLPQVERSSFAQRVPTGEGIWMYTYQTPVMPEHVTIQTFPVDEDFLPTLGMRLVAGRNFSGDLASDSSAAIVNEAAVRALGLGDQPLGTEINEGQRVVGVVSDFNFQSLRHQIEPVVLTYTPAGKKLILKLNGHSMTDVVDHLQALWQQLAPDDPIRYAFLDDNFARLVEQERTLSKAVSYFTLLALLIACIGLFGLTAFAVQRRTKEIGIRKVMGAGVTHVVGLLTKDFLGLVVTAFAVAAPVAYHIMSRWLEGFAYRMELSAWIFLAAGLAALAIALATVSYQAIKAALADPVKSLRYE